MRKLKRLALRCVLLLVLCIGAAGWWLVHSLRPASASHAAIRVTIQAGESPYQVGRALEDKRLIRSNIAFMLELRRVGSWSRIRAGSYRLSPDMSVDEIIVKLEHAGSDSDGRRVTIPEGYTLRQIAQTLVARKVLIDSKEFLEILRSKNAGLTMPFDPPKSGLEGYLYPDTYAFRPNTRPRDMVQAMIDVFTSRFYEPNRVRIEQSGHSLHEIVTIASLVEREAKVERDRARIAGVIENRLKAGMRLQIDATVLYALGHHKSRVMYKDMAVESPYNTYRHKGLPPGPIASPGMPSLRAALAPEKNPYLFYVAGPGGAHIFSRTEREHYANVARMRAMRAATTPHG